MIFGQFQVSDPLFKRELRLERTDYDIYGTRVGEASPNLTYDRGLVLSTAAPGDVDVVLEIVNGNGIPKGEFDNDSNKNVGLRLARHFGNLRLGLFGYWGKEEAAAEAYGNKTTYFGPDLAATLAHAVAAQPPVSGAPGRRPVLHRRRRHVQDPRRLRGAAVLPAGRGRPLGRERALQPGAVGRPGRRGRERVSHAQLPAGAEPAAAHRSRPRPGA